MLLLAIFILIGAFVLLVKREFCTAIYAVLVTLQLILWCVSRLALDLSATDQTMFWLIGQCAGAALGVPLICLMCGVFRRKRSGMST